jgi:2-methylcitrate dehydratase PrpD
MSGEPTESGRTPPEPVREWEASVFSFLEEPVPEAVMERGGTTVADVLASTVAGGATPPYDGTWAAMDLPDGPATVLGTARRTDPVQAATLNGAAAIVQEAEEGHNTGGHVGSGVVVGALAMAEAADADGETLVESVVRAYEVCARMEAAMFAMKDRINDAVPWLVRNPHATWTTVGPALAGALAAGAGGSAAREAFRLAANRAVVSMDDPYAAGPPSRNLTAGASAGVGVTMAQFARAGMPGSGDVVRSVYDPFDGDVGGGFTERFADLGARWAVTENYLKPYPSCRYTHPPLDALRELGDVDPGRVERVVVDTYANAADMAHQHPETRTGAKFSIPYVLARYLVSGSVSLADFEPERVAEPAVQELAGRVAVCEDDGFEAAFPEDWGARVTVHLADGRSLAGERAYPRGDHRDSLDDETLAAKLDELLSLGLPDDRVAGARGALTDIRDRSARSVGAALSARR